MSVPGRAAVACGALGSFRRERVARVAELLGLEPVPVHEDAASILMLDREPVRWQGGRQRGIGWIEADARRLPPVSDWRGAARGGACGLAIEGRRRMLHSAVNGLAPLYWTEEDGGVYFATRIDPLARTARSPLTIDWEAWAAIIAMRYPLGERTPFAEIRRLPQSATLRRRLGRARVEERRWPWAEVEPGVDFEAAAEGAAAGIRAALAPAGEIEVCPLSGGRDSRMSFLALALEGRVGAAATVPDDEGDTHEEDLAGPVAAAFGVPHDRLRPAAADYPRDWEERARRVEYEFVDHAWLAPLGQRVAGAATPVPDGFGIDVFFSVGRLFYTPETIWASDGRAATRALFGTLRRYGHPELALGSPFRERVRERAQEQFERCNRRFEGHPSQPMLSLYSTRSLRGVASYPTKLLGDRAWTLTPGAADEVVAAALSLSPAVKLERSLYPTVLGILDPVGGALPSTADIPRRPPHLQRRRLSAPAREAYRRSLADGPLAPHLSPELRGWLEGPDGQEPSGHLRLGLEAVSLLHAWWRRYRGQLREVDPADLLG